MDKRLILGILYTGFGKKRGVVSEVGGMGGAVRLRLLLLLPCHGGGDDSLQLTLQQNKKRLNNNTTK
jgi:hypothetical protein